MHAQVSGTIDYRDPTDEACLARLRRLVASVRPDPAEPPAPFTPLGGRAAGAPGHRSVRPGQPQPARRIRSARRARLPRRRRQLRRVQGRVRPDARLRHGPARRLSGRHRRQSASSRAAGRRAAPIRRRAVRRQRREGRPLRHELQPGLAADHLSCRTSTASWSAATASATGIIKAGAKLVNAISNSRVPKLTVIVGGSFGAGNYALCGKAFDPRFIFAWPTARCAVMGGDQATSTLLDVTVKSLERQGHAVDAAELAELRDKVKGDYDAADGRPLRRRPRLGRRDPRSGQNPRDADLRAGSRHPPRRK